ncbi:MAG: hypothetical protein HY273_07370 [Gammaproteobacteria bacterium]|nr:hypothetical protein [Gammaproteobacteria bacterium]
MSQQINLYQENFRRQKKSFSARALLHASAAVATGVLLLAGVNLWQTWHLKQDLARAGQTHALALNRLEQTLREHPPRSGNPELSAQVAQLEDMVKASAHTQEILQRDMFRDNKGYSAYLVALARQTVAGVRLTDIEIPGAGRQLLLRGRTTQEAMLLRYLQRLSAEQVLSGMEFPRFNLIRPEGEAPKSGKAHPPADYLEFEIDTAPLTAATR